MLGSGNKSLINKVKMSLDAGCDMVIICNDRSGVKEVIDYLDKTDVEQISGISEIKAMFAVSLYFIFVPNSFFNDSIFFASNLVIKTF